MAITIFRVRQPSPSNSCVRKSTDKKRYMKSPFACVMTLVLALGFPAYTQTFNAWPQWAQNPQHTGTVPVAGQPAQSKLSDLIFDPFVPQETAESQSALLMHYQVPLVSGNNVFMEFKTGTYVSCNPAGSGQPFPCGPDAWNGEIWNETALQWQNGQLAQLWNFASDWTPVPNSGTAPASRTLGGWEPLFQPALAGAYIYVPGAGGTVYKLRQHDGKVVSQINPFGTVNPHIFVAGPLTADDSGNIYYHAIRLLLASPWESDVVNSWLVKIAPDDTALTATYSSLLPDAPALCLSVFSPGELPWPPNPTAIPPSIACGGQRPPLNIAPAISADGSTLYTVSRAHFTGRTAFLLAVNTTDLSLQWSASLEGLLDDGCNVLLPPNGQPGGCRAGSTTGVDPTQNTWGGAILPDQATASPVVAPDGILLGVNTAYNYNRGHLLKFNFQGQFQSSYDFGWDITPAIYPHDGTYSVILKDNHYDSGSYCTDSTWCPKAPPGPYDLTQLDSTLVPQWKYQDATIDTQHPDGYEWCVNAPAVDVNGVVYADDEDGNLYAIPQGGTPVHKLFLQNSLDAGYTPLSIGGDGTIYVESAGHLFAVGRLPATRTEITSSSRNPSTFGTPVRFTARVTSLRGMPTGLVTFKSGNVVLGKGTLSSGLASYTTTAAQLPAGKLSITALYEGDSGHAASKAPAVTQTVNKAASTTKLSAQPNPSSPGQRVTLTAKVTSAVGTPGGTVTFHAGTVVLGTVPLTGGVANLETTFHTAGSYQLKASYRHGANYRRSSAKAKQVVQ